MITIEQQAPPADADMSAAVEAQMGKILIELGGALGVLLTALGTRSGLWSALAGAGPLTVDQVAARVTVDRVLVREWLRAQAAGGYLKYDLDTDRFTLPDAVAGAIVYGPGGPLIDAAATMMSSMGEGFGDFSAAWTRLTAQALAELAATQPSSIPNEFRLVDGRWQLRFHEMHAQLPDSKGLHDIAMLIDANGADVHVRTLVGEDLPRPGGTRSWTTPRRPTSRTASTPSPRPSRMPRSPATPGRPNTSVRSATH